MIRLSKLLAYQLLVIIKYAVAAGVNDTYTNIIAGAKEHFGRQRGLTGDNLAQAQMVIKGIKMTDSSYISLHPGSTADTITQLAAKLTQLLSTSEERQEDLDLLDTIAGIINGPYHRNRLGPQETHMLRDTIMVPSEIGQLKTKLAKKEFYCAGCPHRFVGSELTILMVDENGDPSIYCMNCVNPTRSQCVSCRESFQFSAKFVTMLNKYRICQTCIEALKAKKEKAKESSHDHGRARAISSQELSEILENPGIEADRG